MDSHDLFVSSPTANPKNPSWLNPNNKHAFNIQPFLADVVPVSPTKTALPSFCFSGFAGTCGTLPMFPNIACRILIVDGSPNLWPPAAPRWLVGRQPKTVIPNRLAALLALTSWTPFPDRLQLFPSVDRAPTPDAWASVITCNMQLHFRPQHGFLHRQLRSEKVNGANQRRIGKAVADGQLLAMFQFQSILPCWQTLWQTHKFQPTPVGPLGCANRRSQISTRCVLEMSNLLGANPSSQV